MFVVSFGIEPRMTTPLGVVIATVEPCGFNVAAAIAVVACGTFTAEIDAFTDSSGTVDACGEFVDVAAFGASSESVRPLGTASILTAPTARSGATIAIGVCCMAEDACGISLADVTANGTPSVRREPLSTSIILEVDTGAPNGTTRPFGKGTIATEP